MGESVIKKLGNVFYGWNIVGIAVMMGILGTGLSAYSNGIMLPYLADTLADGSRGEIALGYSIVTIVAAIIAPAVGRFVDTHSPRKAILIGIVITAVSYVMIARVQSVWQFFLAKGVVFGVGITLIGPLTRNRVVINWFDHWRGRALGISVLGASLAGIFFPPIINTIVNELGWRLTFLVFALATGAILLPLVYFLMKDRPEDIGEVRDGHNYVNRAEVRPVQSDLEEREWTWQGLIKNPTFWAIGLIFGPMVCVYLAIMVHLFGHIVDMGLTTERAALVLSTVAILSAIGKPVIGLMADFLGARITIWIALVSQILALVLFTQISLFWQCLVAASLFGFGYAALSSMRTFAISTSLGNRSLGAALGLLKWLELPFAVVASPLAGFVYDNTGSYNAAFLTFTVFLGLACIGPFFIRAGGAIERRAQNAPQPL